MLAIPVQSLLSCCLETPNESHFNQFAAFVAPCSACLNENRTGNSMCNFDCSLCYMFNNSTRTDHEKHFKKD